MCKVILVLCLLMAQMAFAKTIICQQAARDVRLELYQTPDKVKLFVLNPLGYSYLNFIDQPVSEANLENIKYQVDSLRPLGASFWAEWDAKNCKVQITKPLKDTMIECSAKATASSNDKIDFLSLVVSTLTDQSFSGTWKSLRFRMTVSTEGKYGSDFFFMAIPVYEQGCVAL